MEYIKREAEGALAQLAAQFKVVMVVGARQVGKTTMVRHVFGERYEYVSLDSMATRLSAQSDPAAFLRDHPAPVIIDEVQKAPELLDEIKAIVDASDENGRYILTGSQTLGLRKTASESLAGRVGILTMTGLSVRELSESDRVGPHVPSNAWRRTTGTRPDTWKALLRGSAPRLADASANTALYYGNYVDTYIERDVRDVLDLRMGERFYRFVRICAARTGQVVNYSDMARGAGIDDKTARAWLSVLRGSGVVFLVDSTLPSDVAGLAKSPKLYFFDTGLACHLCGLTTVDAVANGPMRGSLFETMAMAELVKTYLNSGLRADAIRYYRETSSRKREIDAVIKDGLELHPVEMKSAEHPGAQATKHFEALERFGGFTVGAGEVICTTQEPYSVAPGVRAVSIWDL